MTAAVEHVQHDELMAVVDARRGAVRTFLDWAESREAAGGKSSMYLANRSDIADAKTVAALYPEAWWGVIVFSCFGSVRSACAVHDILSHPVDANIAEELVDSMDFAPPKVGHHRIQQGLAGAKKALVAAADRRDLLHEVLHTAGSFDDRYKRLRSVHLSRWGRTTCFDLLLRSGALGIGGQHYEPEIAYLSESTGPKAGFRVLLGLQVTDDAAAWCEGLMQCWQKNWFEVVRRVGGQWSGRPYAPGDLENALCIYQEPRGPGYTPPH